MRFPRTPHQQVSARRRAVVGLSPGRTRVTGEPEDSGEAQGEGRGAGSAGLCKGREPQIRRGRDGASAWGGSQEGGPRAF